jgi:hypothetical protein
MLVISVFLATIIANNLKSYRYIGKPTAERDTIAISGEGKVTGIPDVATIDVGLLTEKPDVQSAQIENTTKMNKLIATLKNLGVANNDIQTSDYNIYPQYDYTNGKQVLQGYQVSQSVTVKIRNLDKVGDILAAAGQGGANQVSGLSFSIDDPEALKQEARVKALENAKTKAEALAKVAGVGLGKIVSFSESSTTPPIMYKSMDLSAGIGGGGAMPTPTVQSGSMDIVVDVTVSYEIK